ncbi:MAG: undecaprenyldiphospho-muramoylpentapeptide beta-N-acetylglucosaminyltransferase [Patescibacteria group bacterium]
MKIVFTGGGTGGHVIPNLAVISELKRLAGYAQIFYIGSRNSIEERLAREAGIEFHSVSTGKLRRYFSFQNVVDAVKVPVGIIEALKLLLKLKPNAVFAKGGFVSVPVAIAAGILRIPLVIHESDLTPGLATKITARIAKKICLSFPTAKPNKKMIVTGNPVRPLGSAQRGKDFLKFEEEKPIVLVTGGSGGAAALNKLLEETFLALVRKVNLVWLTGDTKLSSVSHPSLRVFDFLEKEYLDVLAASSLVVSRAGANTIFEIAAAGKPSILIPLPRTASRGDQIENAQFFERASASIILRQEKAKAWDFTKLVFWLTAERERLQKLGDAAKLIAHDDAAEKIAKIILDVAKK